MGLNSIQVGVPALIFDSRVKRYGRRARGEGGDKILAYRVWTTASSQPIKVFPRDRTVGETPGTREIETPTSQDPMLAQEVVRADEPMSHVWAMANGRLLIFPRARPGSRATRRKGWKEGSNEKSAQPAWEPREGAWENREGAWRFVDQECTTVEEVPAELAFRHSEAQPPPMYSASNGPSKTMAKSDLRKTTELNWFQLVSISRVVHPAWLGNWGMNGSFS